MKKLLLLGLLLTMLLFAGNIVAEEMEVYIDPNPPIVSYSYTEGTLIKETVHATPKVKAVSYNITELQAQISKINNVIAIWTAKKAPLQAIIDQYNDLQPEPEPIVEELEGK